ncbi:MAG: ABC transporter permease [Chloroflexi bacterium]|nr:ABC transporter permease [Chloroflexota bacterium]
MENFERIEHVQGETATSAPSPSIFTSAAKQAFVVILVIALFLALWEIFATVQNLPPFFLPKPSDVARRFASALADGTLTRHVAITWSEALAAFSMGLTFSAFLGYALAKSPLLEKVVSPFIVASQSLPIFAIAPFVLIILGSGFWSNALMGALVAFFPMLVNTIAALRNIGDEPRALMRSFAATSRQAFTHLEFPAMLPYLFGGIRAGITLSVIGVLVIEMFWGDRGLGFLLSFARGQFDTPLLFAGILALILMNLTMYIVVGVLERWLMPWRRGRA